jgi:hypothetical protein
MELPGETDPDLTEEQEFLATSCNEQMARRGEHQFVAVRSRFANDVFNAIHLSKLAKRH